MPIDRTDNRQVHRAPDEDRSPPTTQRAMPHARSAPARDRESSLAQHVERQPPSSDYVAFLANVAHASGGSGGASAANVTLADTTRDAAVQAKLDAVRDAFSGPYVVAGKQISARPMFRMTTHVVPRAMAAEVDALGMRAGVRAPIAARLGQCTAKDLVKITQALIDAGHLPSRPEDLAMRIRQMQWSYGIGVDCAGYAKEALAASAQRRPQLYGPGSESFRDLDRERAGSFAKVPLVNARPGDLVTLDGPTPRDWGHNVVVYSHVTADESTRATLGARCPEVRAFLATPGPHHVIEVDSSWGAGTNGDETGGYRRDTWLYDVSTKLWGSFLPGVSPPVLVTSADGPSADKYHGTYRPR